MSGRDMRTTKGCGYIGSAFRQHGVEAGWSMVLYCSSEIFEALDGLNFPATKEDLLDYAEMKDAREAVIVVLNELDDSKIYRDISEVCENARIACNYQLVSVLSHASFPARRDALMDFAVRYGASPTVVDAILALPSDYTFESLDDVCEYVL